MNMYDKLYELYDKRKEIELGGGQDKLDKQHQKGKKSARERLEYLLDAGSFVELYAFMEKNDNPCSKGEGVVTGYGSIDGKRVYVYAQDFTVYGGALGEVHAKKITSIMDMAYKHNAPIIGLNDSGGARIQEGVAALHGYGEIFYRNVRYSGAIPQISVIMGPCAGGAVYSPAITDFVIMVDKTSQMFITGPKVIEMVTGEQISLEGLGGADIHSGKSGNAHVKAGTEEEALDYVRLVLSFLPDSSITNSCWEWEEEYRSELSDMIPFDSTRPYDVRTIIHQLVDEDSFMEIHKQFAKNIVVGFGRMNGIPVGLVCNQPKWMAGGLDMDASDKAARFIRYCDCFHIPIITLEDVTGFFPGVQQEHRGIIRHGAKIIYAFAESTVPKFTVILRKAYGGAYVALNSKALGADMVFAWPNTEIGVMGPEGAVNVLFGKEIERSGNKDLVRSQKIAEYREHFANPYRAAALGLVDDIIDPRETRIHLLQALDTFLVQQDRQEGRKHGNIPL
ncbi:acyl-CoA carboxylase subunit beta [Pontibacillus salicampi]|uniref:Acyl-CoA carboxylase subunit beta n=1 Tax=Pontibacillus salicampi TaxID=1449801 RepID=A0ABV6LK85_9BACI